MIALRLRNLDLVLSKHGGGEFEAPKDCTGRPDTVGMGDAEPAAATPDANAAAAASDEDLHSAPGTPRWRDEEQQVSDDEPTVLPRGAFPVRQSQFCGTVPIWVIS